MEKNYYFKHFDVEKLSKQQRNKKISLVLALLFFLLIIYYSYFPTFTLFFLIAWLGLFISVLLLFGSILNIHIQNKRKWHLIDLIRNNYTDDLLILAQRIEYPYSILKQIIDYLDRNHELYFRFKATKIDHINDGKVN